jgi:putative DNA primase/helicase
MADRFSEIRDCQAELERLCRAIGSGEEPSREAAGLCSASAGDDEELIAQALGARNGEKFRALFLNGDTSAYGGDDSRADLALLRLLAFWTNGDERRIERLFARSALARAKWHERPDYRQRSIATACAGTIQAGSKTAPGQPPSLTESGNAERFIARFGKRVRYCAATASWLIYDGRHWERDETLAVEELAKQALRGIYAEAAACADERKRKEIDDWARRSESAHARRAVLECARSDPRIAVRMADLDADPWLLNVKNGTLDLRSATLRPHDPADLITKLAPASYDPAARSTLWQRALAQATGGDEQLAQALQRAVGYSLTGDTGEEVFFHALGPTATGKSTIIGAVQATLGDYAETAGIETFLHRDRSGGHRSDLAVLEGKRFVVCFEVDRGRRAAEGLLKTITGGDELSVRMIYERERTFRPTFKLWWATNDPLKLADDDEAIWRRYIVFPFASQIAKRDKRVKQRLYDPAISGAAILAWAVAGCRAWQREGLLRPRAVESATSQLRERLDPLAEFFADCAVFAAEAWTANAELRAAYEGWAAERGQRQMVGGKSWGERLRTRGCEPRKDGGRRGWLGIRLLDSPSEGQLGQ